MSDLFFHSSQIGLGCTHFTYARNLHVDTVGGSVRSSILKNMMGALRNTVEQTSSSIVAVDCLFEEAVTASYRSRAPRRRRQRRRWEGTVRRICNRNCCSAAASVCNNACCACGNHFEGQWEPRQQFDTSREWRETVCATRSHRET